MAGPPPPRIGSICTGTGALDAAVRAVFGGALAWVADIDPGARQILTTRYPGIPNIGDITVADWASVSPVDLVCGGYPCQPDSDAGPRLGIADERYIWPSIASALGVLRPSRVVFENVAGHLGRGFPHVLADLAWLGYHVRWATVRASDAGAPHQRARVFIYGQLAEPAAAAIAAPAAVLSGGTWQRPQASLFGHSDPLRKIPPDGMMTGGCIWTRPAYRPAVHPDNPLLLTPTAQLAVNGGSQPPAKRRAGGHGPTLADLIEHLPYPGGVVDWGEYGPAVAAWERTFRPAPSPVFPGRDGQPRLSPEFTEWMMGLPAGHVTGVPGLTRPEQHHAVGNGVCPQQAELALHHLVDPIPIIK